MKPNKFCQRCPRKLNNLTTEPCPMALERINARLADRRADEDSLPGCSWAINSAEYNYCFWNLAQELEGDPLTDKQICQLLNISPTTLDKIWNSILTKLRSRQHEPEIQDWIELLKHRVERSHVDDTIYMPDEFKSKVDKTPEEEEDADAALAQEIEDMADEKEKAKKKKSRMGMPLHRSGDKVDMYGIYSKKTLDRMRTEKKKKDGEEK